MSVVAHVRTPLVHPRCVVHATTVRQPSTTSYARAPGFACRRVSHHCHEMSKNLSRVCAAAAQEVERSVSSTEEQVTIDIASQEAFDATLSENASKLVVLMCKAKGCRPCKQFARKYAKLAEHFGDAVFCEVIGDRNDSTRGMMRSMKIRATPTFVFFRNGEKIHEHSGVNAQKMIDALEQAVEEGEQGYGEEHLHFVNNILSNEEDGEDA